VVFNSRGLEVRLGPVRIMRNVREKSEKPPELWVLHCARAKALEKMCPINALCPRLGAS
jgi:hypothetical protein